MTRNNNSTIIILTILSTFNLATPFTIRENRLFANPSIDRTTPQSILFPLFVGSEPQGEDDGGTKKLILSDDVVEAIGSLGANGGYLDAAKKRNEEAKKKLLEDSRREEEEAEAWRREKANKADGDDFGPKDMSKFKGFLDDGYEDSEGNDEAGGWGYVPEKEVEEEKEDEPKLFLFGDDDDDAEEKKLIL
eukprot:CAMPEP_0198251106 /NCGR_PEP_ID=MMETSP1447-20131203/2053_1 /TAXON_ID=420782 /ORGANISM="Chaetoceros dichaeta, Strain CCMP1751" /LENGTH=190 /DNA_ID=CAMNT_0043936055 /DNA_START=38 /DNA_END=610 /DNA_ORIENTATION=+